MGSFFAKEGVHETHVTTDHEHTGDLRCPRKISAECASPGCTGSALCFKDLTITTRYMSDGKKYAGRSGGKMQLQQCECKPHYAGLHCEFCQSGAFRDGDECIAAEEHRRRETAAEVVRLRRKLGFPHRAVAKMSSPELDHEHTIAIQCDRARTLAIQLGQPARADGLGAMTDLRLVEGVVRSLEAEIGTHWASPLAVGGGLLLVLLAVAGVVLVMRGMFNELRQSVAAQQRSQEEMAARSEQREERLLELLERRHNDAALIGAPARDAIAASPSPESPPRRERRRTPAASARSLPAVPPVDNKEPELPPPDVVPYHRSASDDSESSSSSSSAGSTHSQDTIAAQATDKAVAGKGGSCGAINPVTEVRFHDGAATS